jgi:glycosyltransferase involved in cell wall biosynthesis
MKISIVTPSFNQGQFIEDAIKSVLLQKYKNFEHIIIDACSTDKTLEVLKKYPHLNWVSEPDKGQSDALNKGFKKASGEILVWLNADDYLLPGSFERFINFYIANPENDFYYTNFHWVNENRKVLKTIKPYSRYSYFINSFYGCYIPTSGSFMKKSFFEKAGLLNINFRYKMDTDIFERAGKTNVKFKKLPFIASAFRFHGNNVSFRDKNNSINSITKQDMESIIIKDRCFDSWPINIEVRKKIYSGIWYFAKLIYLIAKYSKV